MKPIRFLRHDEILAVHYDLIQRWGGVPGLRDRGGFESAMAAPEFGVAGQYLHPQLHDMAAAYLYHLVRNHPFVDGNKRIALAAAYLFLWINGLFLDSDQEMAEQIVLRAASGILTEEQVADFIRDHMVSRH